MDIKELIIKNNWVVIGDVNNKEKGSEVDTFEGLKQQVSQIQKLSSSIFFISISTYLKY